MSRSVPTGIVEQECVRAQESESERDWGGRGFLNPSHICVITCMCSESKEAATKD